MCVKFQDGIKIESLHPGMLVHVTLRFVEARRAWYAYDMVLRPSTAHEQLFRNSLDSHHPISLSAQATKAGLNTVTSRNPPPNIKSRERSRFELKNEGESEKKSSAENPENLPVNRPAKSARKKKPPSKISGNKSPEGKSDFNLLPK